MRLQKRIFTLTALLALAWLAFGLYANANNPTPVPASDAGALGRAAGNAIVLTFFACTGLPALLVSLVMRWRCVVGLREQTRHDELLRASSHD